MESSSTSGIRTPRKMTKRQRTRCAHSTASLPITSTSTSTSTVVFGLILVCAFVCSDVGISVSAEMEFQISPGRQLMSSPPLLSSSTDASKSRARIVVPSSCIADDENDPETTGMGGGEGDDVLSEARRSTSFVGSSRRRNYKTSPSAFLLSRDHLGSTPPIAVHRSAAWYDDNADDDTEDCGIATANGLGHVPLAGIEDGRSRFDSSQNNNVLSSSLSSSLSSPPPKSAFKKTGTTIAGCVVQSPEHGGPCVILAADTRATEGTLVADKKCDKIHKLASNCRCCGAGTSADLDKVTRQVLYQMALQELQGSSIGNGEYLGSEGSSRNSRNSSSRNSNSNKTNGGADKSATDGLEILYQDYGETGGDPLLWMRPVSIDLVCRIFQDVLFRNGGRVGANLIVGGVWNGRAYLRAIHPHGSSDNDLPFAALGSGGLAAMAVLEQGWNPSLTLEEGIDLVQRAIRSGIRNDLGSGSQVDLCVIHGPHGSCIQTRGAIPEEELLPDGPNRDGNGSGDGGGAEERDPASSSSSSSSSGNTHRTNRLFELLASEDGEVNENSTVDTDAADRKGHGEQLPAAGVNGFGNQPFAIEATKQRILSVEMDQTHRKETWNRVLGL